jgi:hypothetical protein
MNKQQKLLKSHLIFNTVIFISIFVSTELRNVLITEIYKGIIPWYFTLTFIFNLFFLIVLIMNSTKEKMSESHIDTSYHHVDYGPKHMLKVTSLMVKKKDGNQK